MPRNVSVLAVKKQNTIQGLFMLIHYQLKILIERAHGHI